MSSWTLRAALLAGTALVAGGVLMQRPGAVPGNEAAADLFDPAYVRASACGGLRHDGRTLFQPRLQLALASQAQAATTPADDPPLWEGLGDLHHPITTASPEAQQYFDQGLRLTYAFNHAEARRAFRKAQALDPDCAMCFWGEAFVLGPNINAPMDERATSPSVIAIERAQELAPRAGGHEQALIAALATRYSAAPGADRAALDQTYADAMAEVHERFPDDHDVAALFADAVMNTSPWDYWEPDGTTAKGRIGEAVDAIEGVLEADPEHPGAIHLYIHLTEASATPERAEPHADRLAALMPAAGHIVHMPAHTYYRLGRYLESLELNIEAAKADEAYLEQVDVATVHADGIYPYGYYPHNVHFVVTSAQMAGDGPTSLEAAVKLAGLIPDAVAEQVGLVHPVKAAPYFAFLQFGEPAQVLELPDPGAQFPYLRAMWHYARGEALAAEGDLEGARTEAAAIATLNQEADLGLLLDWAVPAPDLLRLARHVLEGRIAQAAGDLEGAIREFEVAVQIQGTVPYMEPPFWYYPVRQSLGAVLLEAGRAEEAEQAFQETLIRIPNNGWALYGLMEAQQALGDEAGAAATQKLFDAAWAGDQPPELARL